jgi:2-methylcitrate dehydratase PrpD
LWALLLLEPPKDIVKYVQAKGGAEEATLIGVGGKYPAESVAMAVGTLGHTLDFDDASENQCHPTAATLPTALALIEKNGGSGKDLITTIAIANDFSERLGWSTPATIQAGWCAPATKGSLAAAFSGAKALGFDEEQTMRCLGLALFGVGQTSQILQEGGNDVRELYQVWVQRNGVLASELTQLGIKGTIESLEGKFGFYNNYLAGKTDMWDLDKMDVNDDTPFLCNVAAYKPWSSCRQTHPYIDALRTMMKKHSDVKPENVEKINVQVGGLGQSLCTPEESRMSPVNGNDARFSIPWTVAVTLVYGEPSLFNFVGDGLKDEKVRAVSHLVEWESNAELCAQARNSSAIITVYLKDGASYTERCDDALGCLEYPMTEEDFVGKFKDCMSHAIIPMNADKEQKLIDMLWNLEKVEDIRELTALLG